MANILQTKGKKMFCVTKKELKALFYVSKTPELLRQFSEQGITPDVLLYKDKKKISEVVKHISDKTTNDRDEHEVFVALEMLEFYNEDSEACFEMNDSFESNKTTISSIEELDRHRKISSISDFAIRANDGLRDFQLKRYRDKLNTTDILAFLKNVIQHYCNNLGSTNLFVLLQSEDNDLSRVDFEEIRNGLADLKFRSDAQVLIGYNENNEFFVLNQVHPELTRSAIPIRESVRNLYEERKKNFRA